MIGTVEIQRARVFVAFAILDVFVVGHCYNRGVREYLIDGVVNDVRCNNRKTNIVKQLLLHPPPLLTSFVA